MSNKYKNWLDSISIGNGILEKNQKNGIKLLRQIIFPNRKSEEWKSTNVRRLEKILNYDHSSNSNKKRIEEVNYHLPKECNGSIRIILDGINNNFENINFPDGINTLSLEEIQKYIAKPYNSDLNNDWLSAVNDATANIILALKVTALNKTGIEIVIPDKAKFLNSSKILIIVEESAKLDLLQVFLGSSNGAHSNITDIYLDKKSDVNHGVIAKGNEEGIILARLKIIQKEKSKYSLKHIQEGWLLSRLEPEIIQLNGNAETELKGIHYSYKKEELSTHSKVIFKGPNGVLNQLQKSIADNHSHSIFNGLIEVPKIAQRTKASQMSKNILLSNHAQIDTKPELQIIADDVKCNHGATISFLQPEELFYLQSRGLKSEQAANLLLEGYCKEITDILPLNSIRWKYLDKIIK